MLRSALVIAAILPLAAGFQSVAIPLGGRSLRQSSEVHLKRSAAGGVSMSAEINRRSFVNVAAAGVLAAPLLRVHAVQAADDKVKAVTEGIKTINKGGSTGPVPIEDVVLAVIDDGSKDAKAAIAGAKASGASVVPIKYSKNAEKVQAVYKENECYACIVPNPQILSELMKGEGLLCQYCGYAGESPPKWFIVMDGQGQDRNQIMDTAGITGKVCGDDGRCIQMGVAIPVYTLLGLDKITIDPKQGYFAVGDENK
mmetsp:Transcript_25708/g.52349  ORF Transcript_25708/g.52349 Transcript_25708/m.52349 type:complete len:255 (+) Transcript_25708:20-784(+)